MTTDPVHCPYCNASMRLTEEDLRQAWIDCPRCGDRFANRQHSVSLEDAKPQAAELRQPRTMRFSNAGLARGILVVMVVMAGVGLTYALMTVSYRRGNDPQRPAPADQVGALAYLPVDSRLVVGWDMAKMRATLAGQRLLQQLTAGKLAAGASQVQRWTGLKIDDIEQLALGIRFDKDQPPRFTFVVRTAKAYRQEQIANALAPAKPRSFQDRPVYQVRFPLGEALIWCRDERTILVDAHLVAAKLTDLQQLPFPPHKGLDGFPPAVQVGWKEQQELSGTFLAAVGDLENQRVVQGWLKLLPKEGRKSLSWLGHVKTFSFGIRLQEDLTINAALSAQDKKSATAIQDFLQKNPPKEVASYTVVGPNSPGANNANHGRHMVTVLLRMRAEQLANMLQQIPIAPRN